MTLKKYRRLKQIVVLLILAIIVISLISKIYLLSFAALVTGILFSSLIRFQNETSLDEREQSIKEKSAHITYTIFISTLSLGTFLLMFPSVSGLSVFSKGEFIYLESLGVVFAYLTLFLITLYSISYLFLNKKYGGTSDEK